MRRLERNGFFPRTSFLIELERSLRFPHAFQKPLVAAGLLLILSGFFHLILWSLVGGDWTGDTSWRKPILFGISSGITTISIAWVLEKVPLRPGWNHAFALIFSGAILLEVLLITLQTWRGVPSHFNVATPFDLMIHAAMDLLILVIALQILFLTFHSLRKGSDSFDPSMLLALRSGMIFLSIACAFGFWALIHGFQQQSQGLPAEIVGAAGVAKFVHGIPLHAIQQIPILAWLLLWFQVPLPERIWSVRSAVLGMGALTLYAWIQTAAGLSRFEFWFVTFPLLSLSALSFLLSILPLVFRTPPRTCLFGRDS